MFIIRGSVNLRHKRDNQQHKTTIRALTIVFFICSNMDFFLYIDRLYRLFMYTVHTIHLYCKYNTSQNGQKAAVALHGEMEITGWLPESTKAFTGCPLTKQLM